MNYMGESLLQRQSKPDDEPRKMKRKKNPLMLNVTQAKRSKSCRSKSTLNVEVCNLSESPAIRRKEHMTPKRANRTSFGNVGRVGKELERAVGDGRSQANNPAKPKHKTFFKGDERHTADAKGPNQLVDKLHKDKQTPMEVKKATFQRQEETYSSKAQSSLKSTPHDLLLDDIKNWYSPLVLTRPEKREFERIEKLRCDERCYIFFSSGKALVCDLDSQITADHPETAKPAAIMFERWEDKKNSFYEDVPGAYRIKLESTGKYLRVKNREGELQFDTTVKSLGTRWLVERCMAKNKNKENQNDPADRNRVRLVAPYNNYTLQLTSEGEVQAYMDERGSINLVTLEYRNKYQWECLKGDMWISVSKAHSKMIEESFPTRKVVQWKDGEFKIDWDLMMIVGPNNRGGKLRRKTALGIEQETNPQVAIPLWSCQTNNGWIKYDEKLSSALEWAYAAKNCYSKFERNGRSYTVDLKSKPMRQMNNGTCTTRDVCREIISVGRESGRTWATPANVIAPGCVKYSITYPGISSTHDYYNYNFAYGHFQKLYHGPQRKVDRVDVYMSAAVDAKFKAKCSEFKTAGKSLERLLVFHGTNEANIDSIMTTGFKVGGKDVHRANAANYGSGIYTAKSPHVPLRYASGRSVIIAEALVGKHEATQRGGNGIDTWFPTKDYIVFADGSQLRPMYAIHFSRK